MPLLSLFLACTGADDAGPPSEVGCAADELRDDAGSCVPSECGAGEFGEIEDAEVFLREGESIQAAADDLGSGTIALAAGTWDEAIALTTEHVGLAVRGRCSALVTLDASGAEGAVVSVVGARRAQDFAISGMTLTGGTTAGIDVTSATFAASDVVVTKNAGYSVLFSGARATLDHVTISDGVGGKSKDSGLGLLAVGGAEVVGNQVTVTRAVTGGVIAENPHTTIELTDSIVQDTVEGKSTGYGNGIGVDSGGSVSLDQSVVRRNINASVVAQDAGSTVNLTDTQLLDTRMTSREGGGFGLLLGPGVEVTMTNVDIVGTHSAGLFSSGADVTMASVRLIDAMTAKDENGIGISAESGGEIVGTDVTIDGAFRSALALGAGSTINLSDCAIRNVRADNEPVSGAGANLSEGGTLMLTNCSISDVRNAGVVAFGVDARVVLDGVRITDVHPGGGFGTAVGIQMNDGASLVATDLIVDDVEGTAVDLVAGTGVVERADLHPSYPPAFGSAYGVFLREASSLSLRDVAIHDFSGMGIVVQHGDSIVHAENVRIERIVAASAYAAGVGVHTEVGGRLEGLSLDIVDIGGPGMTAEAGGSVACSGCRIGRTEFAGIVVNSGALTLNDSEVTDTLASPGLGGGIGIYAQNPFGGATLDVRDSVVSGNALAAMWVDGVDAATIERSTLYGSGGVALRAGLFVNGNAVFAQNLAAGALRLADDALTGAADAALLLNNATATLSNVTWAENGTDVVQQTCADNAVLIDSFGASAELCTGVDRPTLSLAYALNLVEPPVLGE